MNAPNDANLRAVALDDRYTATTGSVYLSGTQALVRLALDQRRRDLAAGLNTAGYISGYRGSPIGTYDQALWKARAHLDSHHVRFVPGLNEELAATAIWGTQQLQVFPGAKYDGVFSIWYGKGPGVDRAGDALRHANQAGSSRHGGVLAVAGDDHAAKSSTMAAQTDYIFAAVSIPVLAPATVQDYLDLGLHGFAMSRFSGLWVALKAVTDTIETAGIVDVDPARVRPVLPADFVVPAQGLNLRLPEDTFIGLEERLTRHKLPAALAYARANRLDANVFGRADVADGGDPARLAIVATGKAWLDVMQALADIGIDDATARRIGLKVYKVAMPWPLEPTCIRRFCEGAQEVLVVEEKRALVEAQLKEALFSVAQRPCVVGKTDPSGAPLLPEYGELSPALCARVVAQRLRALASGPEATSRAAQGAIDEEVLRRVEERLKLVRAAEGGCASIGSTVERVPYFCSGCPHNTSTRVPEGSRALAGIGCHYMVQWMDRSTVTFTQMGGEGMTWVGQAPFSQTPHVFQNLGDGTYNHSGSLAIRHALATGTRMTFKILFNDAVAMTGGQQHDGSLTPARIAREVAAMGARRIVVVTDEPGKYPAGYFDAGVPVRPRAELDAVQRELREFDGVSVLIYDQTCAAEKRRRRKRGAFPDPEKRAFINESVCEGCGDCGLKSNCVSIEPVETEFGRKRAVNQSSCNKDYSCVDGFCPSFVTVHGGRLRRGSVTGNQAEVAAMALPEVRRPGLDRPYSLLVTGIGGTGVVTLGQILGVAAHLEGKAVTVLDMAGLAQKNGAVMSCVRFAARAADLHAPKIGVAGADAILGCDVVVTAGKDALSKAIAGRTRAVVNIAGTPTAEFTRNADWKMPLREMQTAIDSALGERGAAFVDATRLAVGLTGDAISSNLFMLGYAYQQGLLPVGAEAIERAIELNAVAVEENRAAFAWGRRAAADPARIEELAAPPGPVPVSRRLSGSLDELIARRVDELTDYQDEAYARRYAALVDKVRAAERRVAGAQAPLPLTDAVARGLFRLMAYKDEYEVARLHLRGDFRERLGAQFEGDWTLRFHLAPPLFAKRDSQGRPVKREYGPWVVHAFRVLAAMRRVRGTWLDVFGRTEERRAERRLIAEYEERIASLLGRLTRENLPVATEIAALAERVRGFGYIRQANLEQARHRERELLEDFDRAGEAVALAHQ